MDLHAAKIQALFRGYKTRKTLKIAYSKYAEMMENIVPKYPPNYQSELVFRKGVLEKEIFELKMEFVNYYQSNLKCANQEIVLCGNGDEA
jgi:hypothetical protein